MYYPDGSYNPDNEIERELQNSQNMKKQKTEDTFEVANTGIFKNQMNEEDCDKTQNESEITDLTKANSLKIFSNKLSSKSTPNKGATKPAKPIMIAAIESTVEFTNLIDNNVSNEFTVKIAGSLKLFSESFATKKNIY